MLSARSLTERSGRIMEGDDSYSGFRSGVRFSSPRVFHSIMKVIAVCLLVGGSDSLMSSTFF